MKRFLVVLLVGLLLTAFTGIVHAQIGGHGITRSDGTLVQPDYRNIPDNAPPTHNSRWSTAPESGLESNSNRHNSNHPYSKSSSSPYKRHRGGGLGN